MNEIKLYDIIHPLAQAKRAEWRGEHPYTIAREPLTPIELGHLHAWVVRVIREIDHAIAMVNSCLEVGDADALRAIQYEIDTVVWRIDKESWAAYRESL